MAKTKETNANIATHLNKITDEERRSDCILLIKMMTKIVGEKPKLWGTKIIGFGSYHYRYESGREGDSCLTGFASGKPNISIYLVASGKNQNQHLLKLGKHKMAKACLHIRRLSEVNLKVLEKLISESVKEMQRSQRKSNSNKDRAVTQRK